MSIPEDQPSREEALARAQAAREQMAAALDEDQEPEPDEPLGWQPIWKRPRTPKSKAAQKKELGEQRRRLQDATKRRLAARNSRRPRPWQNRIGNAAARRDARALSRVRHSTAWLRWTMPGIVHRVGSGAAHRDGAPPRPAPHHADDARHSRTPGAPQRTGALRRHLPCPGAAGRAQPPCPAPPPPLSSSATPLSSSATESVSPGHRRFKLAIRAWSRGR